MTELPLHRLRLNRLYMALLSAIRYDVSHIRFARTNGRGMLRSGYTADESPLATAHG